MKPTLPLLLLSFTLAGCAYTDRVADELAALQARYCAANEQDRTAIRNNYRRALARLGEGYDAKLTCPGDTSE